MLLIIEIFLEQSCSKFLHCNHSNMMRYNFLKDLLLLHLCYLYVRWIYMGEFLGINPRQICYHLHYRLLLVSYINFKNKIKFIELHVGIKNTGINWTCVSFIGTIKYWIGKNGLRKDFFWLFWKGLHFWHYLNIF